jgi:hypothetical protein
MPKPSVPRMTEVEAFLGNEPIATSPMNVAQPTPTKLLPVLVDPIPMESTLGHPLGLNIQDILEDFDLELENLVGMGDNNVGHPIAEVEIIRPQPKPLSPIREEGTTSRTATPKRPRSPTLADVDRASGSKMFRSAKAFESKSTLVVKPSKAN